MSEYITPQHLNIAIQAMAARVDYKIKVHGLTYVTAYVERAIENALQITADLGSTDSARVRAVKVSRLKLALSALKGPGGGDAQAVLLLHVMALIELDRLMLDLPKYHM